MTDSDRNLELEGYPPQLHAGKVGIGPHYHPDPTFGEKLEGYKEELKGKLHRNEAEVQHGKDIVSGVEKRKRREADMKENPFDANQATSGPSQSAGLPHPNLAGALSRHDDNGMREQAATVAPADTDHGAMQRRGKAPDRMKHFGDES